MEVSLILGGSWKTVAEFQLAVVVVFNKNMNKVVAASDGQRDHPALFVFQGRNRLDGVGQKISKNWSKIEVFIE